MNRRFLYFRCLLLLEEEQPGQRGVCQGGHNRHFLVLKDTLVLLVRRGRPTEGGYAAAGDAVGETVWILGLNESPMLRNDEELLDIPE